MRTWAEINLNNLEHNYNNISAALPDGCRIFGIVKADAYGHGAVPVAERLVSCGCDYLAVACPSEAEQLRDAEIDTPILILGPTPASYAPIAADKDITLTVGSLDAAREISALLHGKALKLHIKIDTGMGRVGIAYDTGDDLRELSSLSGLEFEGVFTHFAVSDVKDDPFTMLQLERFLKIIPILEEEMSLHFKIKHCANSGSVINYLSETALDMVRAGISVFGLYPGAERGGLELLPVMTVKSKITAIYDHKVGDSISYGRTFIAQRNMRVAVLPVGYADGLHRVLSNKLEVTINGKACKQIGRICMDMCMVDVSDLPDVSIGDVAIIFGEGGASASTLAKLADTISYEIVTSFSGRVPRIYL